MKRIVLLTILSISCFSLGLLSGICLTNDKLATEQARGNVLEIELYNATHKDCQEVKEQKTFIGEHTITFYNLNKNRTATRTVPKHNHTVACDFTKIPKNSYIYIEGYGKRKCEDTGVYGKKIDIYMARPTKELLQMGKQTKNVYILTEKQ